MKVLIFILMFFILGGLLILANNNLILSSDEDVLNFSELYVGWLENFYENIKNITGQVIEMHWFLE
jgi:hypothetical protein